MVEHWARHSFYIALQVRHWNSNTLKSSLTIQQCPVATKKEALYYTYRNIFFSQKPVRYAYLEVQKHTYTFSSASYLFLNMQKSAIYFAVQSDLSITSFVFVLQGLIAGLNIVHIKTEFSRHVRLILKFLNVGHASIK